MDKNAIIEKVIEGLKDVYDPEIPVNIYDLGMVYTVDITDKGRADITMTLTAPNCPAADMIIEDIEDQIGKIEGVETVNVELTFDPPWDKSMMSEEARLELGFM